MKKFLVFLVSIVVVVCLGLTTYYFMRNNEIISIKTKEIYCNAGDVIPLKSLGISIKKANISKKTQFNYNAGGEEVTSFIKYDEERASFIVSQENAGDVTLVIGTTNKKYPDFTVKVHIGNGTQENPYYIFNEVELERIGSTYRLDSHYKLMNDITLTSDFSSIGYNSSTSTWDGFNGTFDGQGYSIKGLNLIDVESEKIGLFSSLGAGSVVKNLTISNAKISGAYAKAGILAGESSGQIEKVIIKNSSITNTASESENGSILGRLNGNIKLSYAEDVVLNMAGTEETALTGVDVGGLIGNVNQATIQACYTNNIEMNLKNIEATAGGLVGEFQIGTETGSIQQSYSNSNSTYEKFGAFIGGITTSNDFELAKANMLKHLIGNIAVVYGASSTASIQDSDLVNVSYNDLFVNQTYADRSAFFDKESALYLIRGFASAGEVISTNEFVYYAIDMNNITNWDTTYVWNISNNSLPTLRMGSIYPTDPSGEYFRRDLSQKDLGNKTTFVNTFSSDVENESIKLLEDVDVTAGWTPVSVKNSTIDGNGKTIKINLNNVVGGKLGLFTKLDNVTIKNLNIVVTGVSANATDAGALAGVITSSDSLTTSTIENVTITFENNFSSPVITNFGGIAGTLTNTNVVNCSVANLKINSQSKLTNAGAIAGVINSHVKVENATITNSSIYATTNVGGVAGTNAGTIVNVTGNVDVNYNATTSAAQIGGVVANNNGSIDNIELRTNISLSNAGITTYVGGVVANNAGEVTNVTISGNGISVNTDSTNAINIGGVVAINNGKIGNVVNNLASVGTYKVGANHTVGGIAFSNNGIISKVVVESNIYGNTVSGVVAQMNNLQAIIEQVVVGKYNPLNRRLSQNEIKADKYVAGVIVDFKAGKIANVQASSKLVGAANTTRSSLVALIFPYGATIQNATINSSLTGYGEKYRETWTDFNVYTNKAEFGLGNGETGDERFNVYKYDTYHGIMQSVVINSANEGVSGAKAAMGAAFMFTKDYQDTAESSFIKVVDGFNDVSQFSGSFEFVCSKSTVLGIEHKATKTLTFAIGTVWETNSGISLMFLDDIFA